MIVELILIKLSRDLPDIYAQSPRAYIHIRANAHTYIRRLHFWHFNACVINMLHFWHFKNYPNLTVVFQPLYIVMGARCDCGVPLLS